MTAIAPTLVAAPEIKLRLFRIVVISCCPNRRSRGSSQLADPPRV